MGIFNSASLFICYLISGLCMSSQVIKAGEKWDIVYQSDSLSAISCLAGSKNGRLLIAAGSTMDTLQLNLYHYFAVMSRDSGRSWKRIHGSFDTITGDGLNAVFKDVSVSRDGECAFIAGGMGVALISTDTGATWSRCTSIPAEYYTKVSVAQDNPRVMFSLGSYHYCILSTDAGQSWKNITPPDSSTFRNVCCIESKTLLAFGIVKKEPRDVIYISFNRGLTWDTLPNPFKRNPSAPYNTIWTYTKAVFSNGDTLIIAGPDGAQLGSRVMITRDGGHTWSNHYLSEDTCYAGFQAYESSNKFLSIGFNFNLYKAQWNESEDGGTTFKSASFPQELGTQTDFSSALYRRAGASYYMCYGIPKRSIIYKRAKSVPGQLDQPQYLSPKRNIDTSETLVVTWTPIQHATAYEFWLSGLPKSYPGATDFDTLYFEKHQISRDTVYGTSKTVSIQKDWTYFMRIRSIDSTGSYLTGDWNELHFSHVKTLSPVEVFVPIGRFHVYPNPVDLSTTISFYAQSAVQKSVSLKLYNNLGTELADFTSAIEFDLANSKGVARVTLPDIPSGVHLLVLSDGMFRLCSGLCVIR